MSIPIIFLVSATAWADPVNFVDNGSPPYPNAKTSMNKESCTKVDLSNKMGPVRNQTGGSCYAYAAMELLNHDQPQLYSALHLTVMQEGEFKQKMNGNSLDTVKGFNGGQIQTALKAGLEHGLCPEKIAPSVSAKDQIYSGLLDYYKKIRQKGYLVDGECALHFIETILDKDVSTLDDIKKMQIQKLKLWRASDIKRYIQNLYPKVNPRTLDEIFWSSKDATDFTKKLALHACKNNLKKNVPPGKTTANVKDVISYKYVNGKEVVYDSDRKAMLDVINKSLLNNKPAGISYYTQGLVLQGQGMHGLHASTVAGRKWVEETRDENGNIISEAGCYYLVKNSWGKRWKPAAGTKAIAVEGKPGFFAMSEKDLLEHVYGTTVIE